MVFHLVSFWSPFSSHTPLSLFPSFLAFFSMTHLLCANKSDFKFRFGTSKSVKMEKRAIVVEFLHSNMHIFSTWNPYRNLLGICDVFVCVCLGGKTDTNLSQLSFPYLIHATIYNDKREKFSTWHVCLYVCDEWLS